MMGVVLFVVVATVVVVAGGVKEDRERPRCRRPAPQCLEEDHTLDEFIYKVKGGQVRVEFLDVKYFVMCCDCNDENKPVAIDDPSLPSMGRLVTVDKLIIRNCLPPELPGGSYANAIAALNVTTTQIFELDQQPNIPFLTRTHLTGLSIASLKISAINRLLPEDGILAEMHKLRTLSLSNVVLSPTELNALPTTLETLKLNNAELSTAEWLGRLFSLKTLVVAEQVSVDANLTFPPLAALPNLREMSLYQTKLAKIEGMINGSALRTLWLNTCGLTTLPSNMFEGVNLTTLSLAGNHLTDLPLGVFSPLRSLAILNLSKNRLTASALRQTLPALQKLLQLNANGNPLGSLCGTSKGLTGKESSLLPTSLQVLELRQTNATRVCSDWVVGAENLTYIDLSINQIGEILYADLEMKRRDRSIPVNINLRENRDLLVNILETDVDNCRETAKAPGLRTLVNLELKFLTCDCGHARLRQVLKECGTLLSVSKTPKCSPPGSSKALTPKHESFLEYNPDELLCLYEDCVPGCTCGKRARGNATVVQCSGPLAPGTAWPASSPRWPLVLDVAGTGLTAVPQAVLEALHAANNNITRLDVKDLPESLIYLDLRNNPIAEISEGAALRLGRSSANSRPLLSYLSGSSLLCDCEHRAALTHLKAANLQVKDLREMQCKDKRYLHVLVTNELCNTVLLPALLGVMGAAFVILLMVVMLIKLRPKIKQILFDHQMCLKWVLSVEDSANDPDKTHDVFISYAYKDHALAMKLMRRLEARGHTTVEHCRDWLPGAAVSEHIARSVICARRTLLLVSDNFATSKWGLDEFRAAHAHALERGSARILVVRCGLHSPQALPPDLRLYLYNNTYLSWDDANFWEKLWRAMPPLRAVNSVVVEPQDKEPPLSQIVLTPPLPRAVVANSIKESPLLERVHAAPVQNCNKVVSSEPTSKTDTHSPEVQEVPTRRAAPAAC